MDVIDYQSKGYLTWYDLKQLCKQSFTLCVDAETKGLKSTDDRQIKPLFEGDKRRYVKYDTNPNFNSEQFEEDMSKFIQFLINVGTFFADLIFDKIMVENEKKKAQKRSGSSRLFKMGGVIGETMQKQVKKMYDKEKQQISLDSIRNLMVGSEGRAEESLLFELLCGFTTNLDPQIEAKKAELVRKKEDDEESVTLFYA